MAVNTRHNSQLPKFIFPNATNDNFRIDEDNDDNLLSVAVAPADIALHKANDIVNVNGP